MSALGLSRLLIACRSCTIWGTGIDRHCSCRADEAESSRTRDHCDSGILVEELKMDKR